MRQVGNALLVGGLSLALAGLVRAQAPPGPLQPPPASASSTSPPPPAVKKIAPRKSIMGDWKLNRDDSDDPRSRMHQATSHPSHTNMGGPQIGWPGGMGGPGYGGNRPPRNPQNDTSQTNEKIAALIDPSVRVHLQQKTEKDPQVELTGDQGKRIVFYTDGKTPDKSTDPGVQQVSAHWDGNKLVTDEKIEKNGTMTRTYSLSNDGLQLEEEVHLTTGKKSDSPVTIRYIYDAVNPDQEY
jgi:hypothetical protein